MSTPRFDLIDATHTIRNRRRLIIIVTVLAALLGALFFFVKREKYEAQTEFFLANPLYADRSYLFRTNEMTFIDFFAGEDDIDKIIVLAESDTVRNEVIRKAGLFEAYKLNPESREDWAKVIDIYKRHFEIKRTEYRHIKMSYKDPDPVLAANLVNIATRTIENAYRGYYNNIKNGVSASIDSKISEIDSTIVSLTDTLAAMRDKYDIYDLISPARQNIVTGNIKSNGQANFGMAVEQIQNIESIKDQAVIDRAEYISLKNEFAASAGDDKMQFIQVISTAKPPLDPAGPGLLITVISAALVGFFFSTIFVLLNTYYRAIIAVER